MDKIIFTILVFVSIVSCSRFSPIPTEDYTKPDLTLTCSEDSVYAGDSLYISVNTFDLGRIDTVLLTVKTENNLNLLKRVLKTDILEQSYKLETFYIPNKSAERIKVYAKSIDLFGNYNEITKIIYVK